MISCDTNILFPACNSDSPRHAAARAFLAEHADADGFCLCEQVLMELYCLLRNPAVCTVPLPAEDAVTTVHAFRSNPKWRIVDVVPDGEIMTRVWCAAGRSPFAYRRIFDARLAVTLQHHGVTDFATRNVRDFGDFGFGRLWDPLPYP